MLALLLLLTSAAASPRAADVAPSATPVAVTRRWDAVGHRAMAALAYDKLRVATRERVDAILREHPDIATLGAGLDLDSAAGKREVFLRASVWADQIRGDTRFYRENDPNAHPTPLLPGFPSMARHEGWHYLTRSFATDGSATISLAEPNVATALPAMADALGDPAVATSLRAYGLTWIIHVVGDLHQPLHGTSRSSRAHPDGDAGGNRKFVKLPGSDRDSTNLHAVWDGWLGRATRGRDLDDVAAELAREHPVAAGTADEALDIPRGAALATAVRRWADESATLARYVAYDVTPHAAGALPVLSERYIEQGTRIARQRLALAAYRLAALIEARLGE